MAYCVQADIEAIFGAANVATWSNLGNATTDADTDRIAAAIAEADAVIDSRFRGSQYAVPIMVNAKGATPQEIKDVSARLAGASLYESRSMVSVEAEDAVPSGVASARTEAHRSMDRILSGRWTIDAMKEGTGSVGPFAVS